MTLLAVGGQLHSAAGLLAGRNPAFLAPFPKALDFAIGARASTLDLYQQVDATHWWRSSLGQFTHVGGGPVHQIRQQDLITAANVAALSNAPVQTYLEQDAAGITYAGTWSTNQTSIPAAHGGTYKFSNTAGSTATVTSPTGVGAISINIVKTTNAGGLAAVTIDGDITRANLLLTAQDVVDAGRYVSSILTSNGGTLDPTQRVIEGYSGTLQASVDVPCADGLDPAVTHTVVVRACAYAPVVSGTANRTYLSAFVWGTPGNPTALISAATSNWDTAIDCVPASGGSRSFIGGTHGYEHETSCTLKVDGVTTTLTDGQIVAPTSSAEITRVTTLTHPALAGATLADVVSVFTLTDEGIALDWTITWAQAANAHFAYVMMPMPGPASGVDGFDKADLSAWPSGPISLAGDPGVTQYFGTSESAAAWLWQSTGHLAAIMWVKNARQFTKNWQSTLKMSVEDRGDSLAKIYLARISSTGSPEVVAPGDVWNARALYRFARFTDPNAVLA